MSILRLMSHNQWKCDRNLPVWEANGWDCSAETRTKGFAAVYKELLPDVIGCQEVSAWMADCLMRYTGELGLRYALLWGRDTPIFYRQDILELVDSDFQEFVNGSSEACYKFQGTYMQQYSWAESAVYELEERKKIMLAQKTAGNK